MFSFSGVRIANVFLKTCIPIKMFFSAGRRPNLAAEFLLIPYNFFQEVRPPTIEISTRGYRQTETDRHTDRQTYTPVQN